MARTAIFLFLLLLFHPSAHCATLTVLILDPSSQPVSGLEVTGWRLQWRTPRIESMGKTDENGILTVVFDADHGEPAPLIWKDEVPYNKAPDKKGYGVYRFLIRPEQYNWELSDLYYWNHPDLWYAFPPDSIIYIHQYESYLWANRMNDPEEPSNWTVGDVLLVQPEDQLFWEVRLSERTIRRVAVRDQYNEPIPNLEMEVSLNHGWWYGSVPVTRVIADQEGYFTFESIGDFLYTFDHDRYFEYYAFDPHDRHGMTSAFIHHENPTIQYKKKEKKYPITIYAIDKKSKKPIKNTTVYVFMSFLTNALGGPLGKTDKNGRFYSDDFQTDHVLSFGVINERYEECRGREIHEYTPNGIYTFELVKKKEKN